MKDNCFKLLCTVFMFFALSVISTSESLANDNPNRATIGDIPGTDSSLLAIQSRRAEGKQLGDKAFRAEIIRAPESVSDLVCLPKLNGNFAGVAKLFSDTKDQVNFQFDINNLCKMALGAEAGFAEELSGLLKVAATGALGLDLPIFEMCINPPVDIGINFDFGLDGNYNASSANQFDIAGCAIQSEIGLSMGFTSAAAAGARLRFPLHCIAIEIPLFQCKGIGQFAGELLDFLGVDGSAILPLVGGGVNGGAMFTTQDEEVSLLAGGNFSLANALGLEEIKGALNFMTDVSLEIDLSFSAGASSTDGLTSDGGVNVSGNAAVMAGTGNSFFGAYSGFGEGNADKVQQMQSDMQSMNRPGAGSLVWNPIPVIGAKAEGKAVIDLMQLARDADPTHNPDN